MWSKSTHFGMTMLIFFHTIKVANQQEDNQVTIMNYTPSNDVNHLKTNAENPSTADTNDNIQHKKCGINPQCKGKAKSLTSNNNKHDLKFFKECIVDYYCYKKSSANDKWVYLPTYESKFSPYFNLAAKRIERFFIRNNAWSSMLEKKVLRKGNICEYLLYIIAARYHYVLYVLNVLNGDRKFGPCLYDSAKKIFNPHGSDGECFVVPIDPVTCTSDFDIALMGDRSGSLAARFNQFFFEPLGADNFVPGFGKSSEDIFGANIFAFTLEYALPELVAKVSSKKTTALQIVRHSIKFQLQEIVTAIRKMRNYLPKYYNDLLMDQAEMKTRPTKQNLDLIFNNIVKLYNTIEEKVASVAGSGVSDISFRYQQEMARSMITGIIESTGQSGLIANSIVEHAMAIIFGAEVYHTTGTVRHVLGQIKMKKTLPMTVIDPWVSMLENWADTVKEFKRECVKYGLLVAQCLPKISKNLVRTLSAMHKAWTILPEKISENSVFKSDLAFVENTEKIVKKWYEKIKRNGVDELPISEKDNFNTFLATFGCPSYLAGNSNHISFHKCLDAIQNHVRKYNRKLFTFITFENRLDGRINDEL